MKQQKKPRREMKVTITFSETNNPIAHRHHGEVPSVNVAAIRQRTGLSQSAFAACIGVPEGTIINWEQGRRQPSGPAKVLLTLLAKEPNLVAELYPKARAIQRWTSEERDPNTMAEIERLAEIGEILTKGLRV
jgi:putative transcriptional regulator